jgi:midasin (ATPase involved in ribosome maturation)
VLTLISKDLANLNDLLRLWFEMVQILNEEDLDPSYYIAFRNLLESWTDRVNGSILSGFMTQVRSQLKALSSSVALSTGISMPLIWNIARPNVPSNLEQWEAYDKLTTLMKNFESKVAFQDRIIPSLLS